MDYVKPKSSAKKSRKRLKRIKNKNNKKNKCLRNNLISKMFNKKWHKS
jgi:hypothetical protein